MAKGHLAAVDKFEKLDKLEIINLATGNGYSVLDVIKAFEKTSGKNIHYKIVDRRDGDIATSYANAEKACKLLAWKAENGIEEMCDDSWRWQSQNPNGYED